MFSDYGKRAYLKVIELEKKFESLQKELRNSVTNTLCFDLLTPERRVIFGQKFALVSKDNSTINLTIDVATDININVQYQLVLDGVVIESGNLANGSGTLKMEIGVGTGELKFQINLLSPITFGLQNLYVTVSGKVEHVTDYRRLSVLTMSDISYVTNINESRLILYGYDSVEGLYELFNWTDVKDVSIAGFMGGELYVLYIDLSYTAHLLLYNPITFEGKMVELGCSGVTSICGYPYGNGIKVFYVLTGNVYSGVFIKGESFTSSVVKRKGVKVTADADVVGAYVISDAYNSNKLVTESSTYVLEKGKNHHLVKTELGYKIIYNNDNVLYEQEIKELVGTPTRVGYCDEKLRLCDGKNIIRVREALKISEE